MRTIESAATIELIFRMSFAFLAEWDDILVRHALTIRGLTHCYSLFCYLGTEKVGDVHNSGAIQRA